jgi:phosphoribosylformimino-5-aminoimidazole carboxamide ribotide isomerase
MTRFRPCIDLHAGQVKQIVGGTLDSKTSALQTNFVSPHPPAHFATLYRDNALTGAHVIMLGPGNRDAARESLAAWPGGLQVGGGINDANAREWIDAGADKIIITSFLFPNGTFSQPRLDAVLAALDGDTSKLVIDLSCRRHGGEDRWFVAMDKWQTITDMEVNQGSLFSNLSFLSPLLSSHTSLHQNPSNSSSHTAPSSSSTPPTTRACSGASTRGSSRSWPSGAASQ